MPAKNSLRYIENMNKKDQNKPRVHSEYKASSYRVNNSSNSNQDAAKNI